MLFFQDSDAKLTLTRVATAPVLVAEIAKATGQRLEVSPSLGMEVLMVSVEGVRAGDVLARLAVAATAAWQPIEGGYRLVPDNAARGIEASSERARRIQAINEGVKKRLAKSADANADAMGAMMANRSIDALVPMLDVGALASMEEGDRLVFATGPTSVQRPLRGNATGVVANLIAGHNEQAKKMSGQMDEMPDALSSLMSGPIGERLKRMSQPVTGTPTKIMVVATKGGLPFFGGGGIDIRLEARVYGADGKVLLEESGTLDADLMTRIMAIAGKKSAATAADKATPIVYSPEAKALAATAAMPSMEGGMGMTMSTFEKKSSLPLALRTYLLAPQQSEPLALVPGEGLAALAKARRKPLVACLPDDAFPAMLSNPAPKTIEEVEKGLQTGSMRLVPDVTFLLVKASDPDAARRNRLDRVALGILLREAADHQAPTLSELAAFAARTPDPSQNRLSQSELTLFVPSTLGSMTGMVSWPALRLYDALAPAQRQSLEAGAQVPFSALVPAAKAALRSMLYGSSGRLTLDSAGAVEDDPVSIGMRMALGGGGVDAQEEPTEAAPNGLPAGGYLQALVTAESIIRPMTPDGPSASVLGTDELAMVRLMATSPMASQMGEGAKLPESGILGSRKAWRLRGYVAPAAYVSANLDDDATPKNGRAIRLADLPQNVQDQVARRADQLKKSPLGAILSMDPSAFGGPKAKP